MCPSSSLSLSLCLLFPSLPYLALSFLSLFCSEFTSTSTSTLSSFAFPFLLSPSLSLSSLPFPSLLSLVLRSPFPFSSHLLPIFPSPPPFPYLPSTSSLYRILWGSLRTYIDLWVHGESQHGLTRSIESIRDPRCLEMQDARPVLGRGRGGALTSSQAESERGLV